MNDKDDSYKNNAPVREFSTTNEDIFYRIIDADFNNF